MVTAATYRINLHCPECAKKIRRSLLKTAGIHTVDVNIEKNEVRVVGVFEAKKMKEKMQKFSKKVEEIKVETDIKETVTVTKVVKETKQVVVHETTLKVHMHCEQCQSDLRRKLLKHKGIYNVKADMKAQKITVEGTITGDELVRYIRKKVGMHAETISTKQMDKKEETKKGKEEESKKGKEEEPKKKGKEEESKKGKEEEPKKKGKEEESKKGKEEEPKKGKEEESKKDGAKVEEKTTQQIIRVTDVREVDEVEQKLRGMKTPYIIHYVHAPQWFSDEDPNSCRIM